MKMKSWVLAFLLTVASCLLPLAFAQAQMDTQFSGFLKDQNGNFQRIKYATINPSTATTTDIVAAQGAGTKIRVIAAVCVPTLANSLTFNSSTAGAISALFPVGANGMFILGFNPHGWFETAANEKLQLVTSAATVTGCSVAWISSSS